MGDRIRVAVSAVLLAFVAVGEIVLSVRAWS